MADAVELDQVVKTFGRLRALDALCLSVASGQVYGLLGPNGAGKTTTIRLLLDFLRPTSGSVLVLGVNPRIAGPGLHRRIGYVPGDFRVDGRQSSREFLTYVANMRGGIPASRVAALAEQLGLRMDSPISTLSRGNRQKVALVQAFMHEPELLVLDEPTSGLDPFVQQEFRQLVREAAAEGRTVLMSSHVMGEVQQAADRVGIVRDGRLIVDQDVRELRERATRRVEVVLAADARIPSLDAVLGVSDVVVEGRTIRLRLDGAADGLVKALASTTVVTLTAEEPELEDVFFAAEGDRGDSSAA